MSVQEPSDTAQDPAVSPRLDGGTQLVTGVRINWWPHAGEAVAFLGQSPRSAEVIEQQEQRRRDLLDALDPDEREAYQRARDGENRERAERRAKSRLRRYVVANGMTRIVTLTFAPTEVYEAVSDSLVPERDAFRHADSESSPACGQPEVPPSGAEAVHRAGEDGRCVLCGRPHGYEGVSLAMQLAARWVRLLRRSLRVDRLPYVLVPEFHKDHHVHLHVMLDRFIEDELLELSWGWGFVDAGSPRKLKGGLGGGAREAARKAARYGAKYLGKGFADGIPGRHRYEVAEGYQPAVVKRGGYRSLEAAVAFCEDHGERVTFAVHSDGLEDYDGPPFLWVALEATV